MLKKLLVCSLSLTLLFPMATLADSVLESTISSEANQNREVAPDTVKIKFYVENSGMNLSDIKEKNDKLANDAITKIKAKLAQNEQIKTIAFSVRDVYSYKDKTRIFQKYEVTNGFEVTLHDLDKISSIIKLAMDSGVKRVDSPVFSIENSESICNELLAKAAKSAKNRAYTIAQAIGSDLSKPKSINPYCSVNSNQTPRYYNTMMAKISSDGAGAESAALDVIEAGTINIRASVNMTYYLK